MSTQMSTQPKFQQKMGKRQPQEKGGEKRPPEAPKHPKTARTHKPRQPRHIKKKHPTERK